jgi:hypothetical protein
LAKNNFRTPSCPAIRKARHSGPSDEAVNGVIFIANYGEGAVAGYKWFAEKQERPLFPFGFGLSYTNFSLHDLAVAVSGNVVKASVSVRNIGEKPGVAIPQFYVSGSAPTAIPLRLAGWSRTVLQPGEERRATCVLRSAAPRQLRRGRGPVEDHCRGLSGYGRLRRGAPGSDGERKGR